MIETLCSLAFEFLVIASAITNPLSLFLVGEAEPCVRGPQNSRMEFGVSQTTDLSNDVQFEGAETELVYYKTWLCYHYGE
jgi:hypothetical protein